MHQLSRETHDPKILLGLLTAIERDRSTTQRKLARDLNIALGLANAYIRRCVRKGLVKISQVPLNRHAYYLTPQGFAEKTRLTAEYLTASFNFFRRARSECAELLRECAARGWKRVALYGVSDLAEIAVISAGDSEVDVVFIIDAVRAGERCAGVPVVADLAAAQVDYPVDGVILTDTHEPQIRFDELAVSALVHGIASDCILAPSLLGISRLPMVEATALSLGERKRP